MTEKEKRHLTGHKNAIWHTYDLWRKTPIYCPALNVEVSFTLKGWKHTVGEDKKRNLDDINVRLEMIKKVRDIIERSNFFQDVESHNGNTRYTLISVEMLKEIKGKSYNKLFVILEKDYFGKIVFYSVFRRRPRF